MSGSPVEAANGRQWLLPGVLVALLAGAAAVMLVVSMSGGASGVDSSTVLAQESDEDEAEESSEELAVTYSPDLVYDFFLSRDPFEPVVPEPVDTTPPSDPSQPSDPTDPTDPSQPSVPTDPSTPGSPSQPADPSDPATPQPVELLDVHTTSEGEPIGVFQVGSSVHQARVGETFAGLLVVAIDGDCATWLRGDQLTTRCVNDGAK